MSFTSGRISLAKKLGIKPGIKLVLLDPPGGFLEKLGELPKDITVFDQVSDQSDLAVLFVEKRENLESRVKTVANKLQYRGRLWIAWKKGASRSASDVTEKAVREVALGLGLVDYKVCSIDEAWSALLFSRRK